MITIENENEAAIAIFVAAISADDELTEFEIQKIANTLVFCKKFQRVNFKDVTSKIFYLKQQHEVVDLIKMSAKFISSSFAHTFYAMLCDIVCSDGNTSETDMQLMALIAGELMLSEDEYLPIAKSFMTRYAWNINLE